MLDDVGRQSDYADRSVFISLSNIALNDVDQF